MELKFRAWHNYTKKYHEIVAINFPFNNIAVLDDNKISVVLSLDEFILEQYTGMEDKNGAEIYEGDIVKMHYFYEGHDPVTFGRYEAERNVIGVVKIDTMGTYTETNEEYGIYHWLEYLQEPAEELEVIGNIHENQELLK